MKIALIGYGKMGHIIERICKERGHEVVSIIDIDNRGDMEGAAFGSADVAIEFTMPGVAVENIKKCMDAGVAVVCGTTGWMERMGEVKKYMEQRDGTLFWSSNYSIGVNVFMAVNRYLARLMNGFEQYEVEMTEVHHVHKLDAPSGTAITLAEGILEEVERKKTWVKETAEGADEMAIKSIREGEVPGIHKIRWESGVDSIEIVHDAKSREGFALGAVIAAEYTCGKKGLLGMSDMLKF